jgi:hypothetical protein
MKRSASSRDNQGYDTIEYYCIVCSDQGEQRVSAGLEVTSWAVAVIVRPFVLCAPGADAVSAGAPVVVGLLLLRIVRQAAPEAAHLSWKSARGSATSSAEPAPRH